MELTEIQSLQEQYGFKELQDRINSGIVWKMEGSQGRAAMSAIEAGACMLGEEPKADYWGNRIPVRSEVKEGTKGSFQNSVDFWSNPDNYEEF